MIIFAWSELGVGRIADHYRLEPFLEALAFKRGWFTVVDQKYGVSAPPSTSSTFPVIHAAAALHKNTAAAPMSSGCPKRPKGVPATIRSRRSGVRNWANVGVRIAAGAIAFMRTDGAKS